MVGCRVGVVISHNDAFTILKDHKISNASVRCEAEAEEGVRLKLTV